MKELACGSIDLETQEQLGATRLGSGTGGIYRRWTLTGAMLYI
jgi:hypothetical protein